MFKTQDGDSIAVNEHTADDSIMHIFEKILPGLAKTIQSIPLNLRPPVYIASYQYGTQIIDENGVYLPLTNGNSISFKDPRLPDRLAKGLGCDLNVNYPMGVLLKNSCEYFGESEERIVPYTIISPGEGIGLNWALKQVIKQPGEADKGPASLWDLVAGARSIFLLSKISDKPRHIKLQKRYGISADLPTRYQDHWHVFKDIARKANSPWHVEILFFDNRWFNLLKDPNYGPHLFMQLSIINKRTNRIWHHMPGWDKTYGQIELKKSLNSYPSDILYTCKHIFAIIANCAPGFKPATNDNSAPVKLIQEAYSDNQGYNLEYCTSIMESCMFNEEPVYYSTNYPTLPQYSHQKRRVIDTLHKVKNVMEFFQKNIQSVYGARVQSLLDAAQHVDFSYYHDNPGDYGNIKSAKLVAEEDRRFITARNCTFPGHSAFVTGLIKISPSYL